MNAICGTEEDLFNWFCMRIISIEKKEDRNLRSFVEDREGKL